MSDTGADRQLGMRIRNRRSLLWVLPLSSAAFILGGIGLTGGSGAVGGIAIGVGALVAVIWAATLLRIQR